jgi:hypothetical protein
MAALERHLFRMLDRLHDAVAENDVLPERMTDALVSAIEALDGSLRDRGYGHSSLPPPTRLPDEVEIDRAVARFNLAADAKAFDRTLDAVKHRLRLGIVEDHDELEADTERRRARETSLGSLRAPRKRRRRDDALTAQSR